MTGCLNGAKRSACRPLGKTRYAIPRKTPSGLYSQARVPVPLLEQLALFDLSRCTLYEVVPGASPHSREIHDWNPLNE